ncbi:hypothetical protein C6H71_15700 [Salmonella enterica subsp. diarizonae serovar 48:i:z]|nr:hypothetical protein C6H71_15700 [Salmonella enterica subsp. diarizonae serovar 48:i:z]
MTKNTRFSPEVRQRAIRMVIESQNAGTTGLYPAGRSRTGLVRFHHRRRSGSLSSQTKYSPGKPGRFTITNQA